MNKKLIAIVMTALMLLTFVGCNTVATTDETGSLDSNNQTTNPTNDSALEAIPGVIENPNPDSNPLDETEFTPAPDNIDPSSPTSGNNDRPSESTNPSTDGSEDSQETIPPTADGDKDPENPTPPTTPGTETTSYAQYLAMSPEEQYAFFCTFDSMEDFVAWYNAAKAEYDAQHPDIDIGDGNIDIGDIIGKP